MLFFDHLRSKNGKYGKANLESCQKAHPIFPQVRLSILICPERAERALFRPEGAAPRSGREAPHFSLG